MNRILFPIEFSSNAKNNFLYALDWAKKFDATLVLMHALRLDGTNPLRKPDWNKIGKENIEKMKAFVAENLPKKYSSVGIEYTVQVGFPVKAIELVIEEENIDMVVMGMRAHPTPMASYFSSVAMEVVSSVKIPVFLVPNSNKFEEVKNMTYTFNFEFKELVVIRKLLKWAKKLKTPLKCLHVLESDEIHHEMEFKFATIKELYQQNKKYSNLVTFDMTAGKFEEIIEFLGNEEEMDLLVMLTHQRNYKMRYLEPSTTNKVARKMDIPMLILKEDYIFTPVLLRYLK